MGVNTTVDEDESISYPMNVTAAGLAPLKEKYAVEPDRTFNIFITDTSDAANGLAVFPWEPSALEAQGGIWLRGTSNLIYDWVPTHEAGHALGLWHVFHGT